MSKKKKKNVPGQISRNVHWSANHGILRLLLFFGAIMKLLFMMMSEKEASDDLRHLPNFGSMLKVINYNVEHDMDTMFKFMIDMCPNLTKLIV
jgi:hypothetical protein